MKALLLKDIYALKEARVLLVFTLFIAAVMGVLGNAVFIQSYLAAISAVLVLNTIAYDEVGNGYAFLFTLPVSRKQYVVEKYIFGAATAFAGWFFALILSVLTEVFFSQQPGEPGWPVYMGTLFIILIMQAGLIPIKLKFGGQKGKIAILLVFAMVFGCGMLCARLVGGTVDNGMLVIGEFFSTWTPGQILGAGAAVFLVCAAVSLFCSMWIMDHKAF